MEILSGPQSNYWLNLTITANEPWCSIHPHCYSCKGCIFYCCRSDISIIQHSCLLSPHQARCGHKASLSKLQWCKQEVQYFGLLLLKGQRVVSTDHVFLIQEIPPPETPEAMMSFPWPRDKILRQACVKNSPQSLVWSTDTMHSFAAIKAALCSVPALGLPDYNIPFHLYVPENGHTSAAMLAYPTSCSCVSEMFPVVVQGMPVCLRALAACAMMITLPSKHYGHCTSGSYWHSKKGVQTPSEDGLLRRSEGRLALP